MPNTVQAVTWVPPTPPAAVVRLENSVVFVSSGPGGHRSTDRTRVVAVQDQDQRNLAVGTPRQAQREGPRPPADRQLTRDYSTVDRHARPPMAKSSREPPCAGGYQRHHGTMTTLLLVHGGLWEDMDAARFWDATGIVTGLALHGFEVLAPTRLHQAPDWAAEAGHLAPAAPGRPVTVLAGSNGCSAAVRLALDFPGTVARLILAWPATAGDPVIDAATRAHLTGLGASPAVTDALLAGPTLRGVTDEELAALTPPVGVLPPRPASRFHQRHTVDALLRLLPRAEELPGCPEPPHPDFAPHLATFLDAVAAFART